MGAQTHQGSRTADPQVSEPTSRSRRARVFLSECVRKHMGGPGAPGLTSLGWPAAGWPHSASAPLLPSPALCAHQHPHVRADRGGWPRRGVRVPGPGRPQASGDMEQGRGAPAARHCAERRHRQDRPRGAGGRGTVSLHCHQRRRHHPVPRAAACAR